MSEQKDCELLPLEKYLKSKQESDPHFFPQRSTDYLQQYLNIKNWLKENHFRDAAAGLAADGNRYTQHDLGHVNDVVEMAGILLRIKQDEELLTGFEAYLLLVSILLHDSGNAHGRENHEKRPKKILASMGDVAGNSTSEKRLIAKIAEAHGGTTLFNNIATKDTITNLIDSTVTSFSNDVTVRPRLLAAILRLSDELAEKPSRANKIAAKEAFKEPESGGFKADVIHNLYCHVIEIQPFPESHEIKITFDIDKRLLGKKFPVEEKDGDGGTKCVNTYLSDYIAKRLEKTDRERRYCNRFMMGLMYFDTIRVDLVITDDFDELDRIEILIEERGFPGPVDEQFKREVNEKLKGAQLREQYGENQSSDGDGA